ncbi:helix-turn-helix transcriptional regulator [Timonella sp. A28]|uniref:helix-turn-helix transcriptional regulator n=1 Tax=Timonella sp. A28 TaxID=3442640 RepID=UPI003EBB6CA6
MFLTSGTDVARTIRNARTTAGLSQTELASQVGVGRQSIARIEAGNAAASLDTFLAIFRILNITLEAHTHDERQNVGSLSEHWSARLADQARGLTKTSALTALLGVNRTQDSAFHKVSGDGA